MCIVENLLGDIDMKSLWLSIILFTFCGSTFADTRGEFQAGFASGDPEITFAGVSEDLDVDTGINLGANLWFDDLVSPNLSFGLSVNRATQADFSESAAVTFLGVTLAGTLDIEHDIDTVMFNVLLRDNSAGKKIRPYIGGGVGFANVDAEATLTATITVNGQAFTGVGTTSDDDTNFAAQFMAGADFEITENVYVGANLGYFMTEADLFGAEIDFDTFRGNLVLGVKF